jgi:EAL domain-containing protein (putative c-di-GMP-specific phosphodiesterase class I)
MAPHLDLAMEIHENAITNIAMVRELKALLKELNMKLVYDDFGAGQSRLIELMDAPPDVLKFDYALVHDIHRRSDSSLKLISSLVETARGIGIINLAEGIELREEAEVCRQLGFDLAQGFYYGRPSPGFDPETSIGK